MPLNHRTFYYMLRNYLRENSMAPAYGEFETVESSKETVCPSNAEAS